jgi:lipoate-protein ligase A
MRATGNGTLRNTSLNVLGAQAKTQLSSVCFVTCAVGALCIWRMLRYEAHDASMNMAIDEAILESRIQRKTVDTLRFYGWKSPGVSVGRFQVARNEVQLENCLKMGVDVVRRITGGGSVFHDDEGEITYSVASSMESLRAADVAAVYSRVAMGLTTALDILGLTADFNEGTGKVCPNLTVKGRKISGSAQCHRHGMVLQHGTILLSLDLEQMFKCLRVPWAESCLQVVNVARGKITSLEIELGRKVSRVALNSALVEGFQKALGIKLVDGCLTDYELDLAKKLRAQKYSKAEWNLGERSSEL